jgi:catechol 2,3-dioxygenase
MAEGDGATGWVLAPTNVCHWLVGLYRPGYDALLGACEGLLGDGIRPPMVLDHGMTLSFYFVDPDGNSVELQADNFGDWKRSTQFMRTAPEFAANPIGVPVDPGRIIAAWREGATDAELHERAYAGEFTPEGALDLRLPAPE